MPDEVRKLFDDVYWHQKWEIAPGVFTPGHNDIALLLNIVGLPPNLSGARVLDIGAWNGCCSFECERRGAEEVLAIGPEDPHVTGFAKLRAHLRSRVKYEFGSVYDLDPDHYGQFDIILFFGVFYHLRYPLLALDNIRRVARKDLYFESSCITNEVMISGSATRLKDINPLLEQVPLLEFFPGNELNNDFSNWFSPNREAVRTMLASSGFIPTNIAEYGVRIAAQAYAEPGWPEFLRMPCGENEHYRLFLQKLTGPKTQFYRS